MFLRILSSPFLMLTCLCLVSAWCQSLYRATIGGTYSPPIVRAALFPDREKRDIGHEDFFQDLTLNYKDAVLWKIRLKVLLLKSISKNVLKRLPKIGNKKLKIKYN